MGTVLWHEPAMVSWGKKNLQIAFCTNTGHSMAFWEIGGTYSERGLGWNGAYISIIVSIINTCCLGRYPGYQGSSQ